MQKKWLLDFEVREARKIAKSKLPQRNKNQENEVAATPPLTDEEKDHLRSYNSLMPLAARSVKKLDSVLLKASNEDSRNSGIGNYGGHIARELKLPGPLNGLEVHHQSDGGVTSPFYVKLPKRKEPPAIEDPDDLNPPWNKNFVNDHHDRENCKEMSKNEQYLLLKLEMHSFVSGGDGKDKEKNVIPTLKYSFPQPLPEEAWEEWEDMLKALHIVAVEVNGNDLMEFSCWLKPPPAAVDILGYLCILLGLNPEWGTMKRLLLRNIPALLNFVHKVFQVAVIGKLTVNHCFFIQIEPNKIPLQRIISASKWREEHIPVLSHTGMEKVNHGLSKLTRWVLYFNRMVIFYFCATADLTESDSNSVWTVIKEKQNIKENTKGNAEKQHKNEESKENSHQGKNKDLRRSGSKRLLQRGSSKHLRRSNSVLKSISRGPSIRDIDKNMNADVGEDKVDMHRIIQRNASMSNFNKVGNEGSAIADGDINYAAAAEAYLTESRPASTDPILGRRRVSVVSQILQKDSRRISVASTGNSASRPTSRGADAGNIPVVEQSLSRTWSKEMEEEVSQETQGKSNEVVTGLEAHFWKSIGAAFMLDDKGQIILSNGKDIGLYQGMLLGDETVTSDYSKHGLSGSDLALTTRRRKIVAENRDMIHSYIGRLIKQASNDFALNNM